MKLGCCCWAAGGGTWPYDVEPPELVPPLLLVGEAHGSLGEGVAIGSADAVDVGVGVVSPALRRPAAAEGLRLSTGTGSDDDDGVDDAEPEADGEALASSPHSALSTGFAEGDELVDGEALAD